MRIFRAILAYVLAVGLIAYACVWTAQNWEKVSKALELSPGYLAALAPLAMISILLIGLMNQLLASHLGAPLPALEWMSLGFASTLANYVLPLRAGMALRAGYYKRRMNLPLANFASAMAVSYVMTALANALIVLGVLAWFSRTGGPFSAPLLWGAAGVSLLCVLVLGLSLKTPESRAGSGIVAFLVRVHAGWNLLRQSPWLLAKTFGLSAAGTALCAAELWIAFAAIGHSISPAGCLLIGALAALSMFISLTPASLGIREAAIVFSGLAIGVPPEVTLFAGALDRAVSIFVVVGIGTPAALHLSRKALSGSDGVSRARG
jgi:uncharacterized membrane protein YbhN (UPF0104 family)